MVALHPPFPVRAAVCPFTVTELTPFASLAVPETETAPSLVLVPLAGETIETEGRNAVSAAEASEATSLA
jgi:hypothetical protein